ncbi:hypothetical protein CFP56_000998 [Quercus suber]|uniref:Uncharacterized protein n=1 Tax=Quercus suber TaxID=58331 RepID=A0AAW0LFY5_QUESU
MTNFIPDDSSRSEHLYIITLETSNSANPNNIVPEPSNSTNPNNITPKASQSAWLLYVKFFNSACDAEVDP